MPLVVVRALRWSPHAVAALDQGKEKMISKHGAGGKSCSRQAAAGQTALIPVLPYAVWFLSAMSISEVAASKCIMPTAAVCRLRCIVAMQQAIERAAP
jgi:hypothetical protein